MTFPFLIFLGNRRAEQSKRGMTTNVVDMSKASSSSSSSSDVTERDVPEVGELGLSLFGNGEGKPLTRDQLESIETLYNWAIKQETNLRSDDGEVEGCNKDDTELWCERETARRFLVARKWNLTAAQSKLGGTLKWRYSRDGRDTLTMEFWESPKALQNPLALCLRVVGYDKDGRPIIYTNFKHAHDRWDVEANILHLTLVLETCCRILKERCKKGWNKTASSRQWIFIIDFDGFGIWDQNPKTATHTIKVLDRYPELMNRVIMVNAPFLFSATWKMIKPLLDSRVKEKVVFLSDKAMGEDIELRDRLGDEAMDWILREVRDNLDRRSAESPKRYWVPPSGEGHDSRGIQSYVEDAELYAKTPGDVWQERQEEHEKIVKQANGSKSERE